MLSDILRNVLILTPSRPECVFIRFSHGEVVCVSELRDFLEADISNMELGSACLAKREDGIWYPARISGTKPELFDHQQKKK